jgi:2-polyprenyl-3-methyl-5-hydroxy-6-metoxy-1,4-benzoquinol methylase
MESRLDPPACPACGGASTVLVDGLPDALRPGDLYRVARCRACRVAFTDPIRDSYPAGYEPYQIREPAPRRTGTRAAVAAAFYGGEGGRADRLRLLLPSLVVRARGWMKMRARDFYARPFRRRGRLLDVGSGSGDTLRAWAGQQERCVGVEVDARAAALGRERLGLDIRVGRLEDQAFEPASFDVVTLSHVLEHVPDPAAALARCASLLRPGGEILVWVPNFESPFRSLFGAAWFPYEVPRHRWHFRPADVAALLVRAGLAVVEVLPDPTETLFRKSARRLGGALGALLGRRAVRAFLVLAARFARRSDAVRIRAVRRIP